MTSFFATPAPDSEFTSLSTATREAREPLKNLFQAPELPTHQAPELPTHQAPELPTHHVPGLTFKLFAPFTRQIHSGTLRRRTFVDYHLYDATVRVSRGSIADDDPSVNQTMGNVCIRVFSKETIILRKDGPVEGEEGEQSIDEQEEEEQVLDDYIAPPWSFEDDTHPPPFSSAASTQTDEPATIQIDEQAPTHSHDSVPIPNHDLTPPYSPPNGPLPPNHTVVQPMEPHPDGPCTYIPEPPPTDNIPPTELPYDFVDPRMVLGGIGDALDHLNDNIMSRFAGNTYHKPNLLHSFNYLRRQVLRRVGYLMLIYSINQDASELHSGLTVIGMDLYEGVIALMNAMSRCCLNNLYYFTQREAEAALWDERNYNENQNPRERHSGQGSGGRRNH
ncbi:hypothetical protein JAAARDRAFT_189950 [Jaapia argillacea MUCL 33604]|uniref:Uncharacterized protein n=1 Tax=Jaapia argillacea MUCL 33604 TaxID=933084 RepID=A0A067QGL2_9AGAM|nr:hypothetical protein JAAARDRAFT_189950 [Jaapia argillacea MUCL 33604]